MGRQQLLLSIAKPPILLNMKEWRLSWEHKFFLATLIASQVIGVISAFDCRFFIFHPECRGQYGKRSTLPALAQLPHLQSHGSNGEILDLNPETDLRDDVSQKIKELLEYCSRYVFAPICRGVTSKRATISPLVGNNHAIFDLILRQIKKQQEENTKSEAIELPQQLTKDSPEEEKKDSKDIDIDIKPFEKRQSWNLNDLGGFTSFYRKRWSKKSAPSLDDLDTFTSFIKKRASPEDLGLFTTFIKKSDKDLQQQRDNAINALSSFTTFYKRNSNGQERFRRQALEDLGAFTTFMKKADPKFSANNNKRSTRSISREDLRDALGTFSSFMDPYQYYKRTPNNNHIQSSSIG